MCGGSIIGATASAVSGRYRLSPPNDLSSFCSQQDKPLGCGGIPISNTVNAAPASNRLSGPNGLS